MDHGEAHQVAVERDRALGVAADRGHVVQPAQLHALLVGGHRVPEPSCGGGRRAAGRRTRRRTRRRRRAGSRSTARRRRTARRRVSTAGQRREQQRVRLEAGEVLAQRGVEAAQRGQRHAADEQHAAPVVVAPDQAPDEQHQPDQHAQLDQRERVPRRARALVAAGGARRGPPARRRPRRAARGALAIGAQPRLRLRLPIRRSPANGQPEETFTRHQPISMPMRPRRGRTSQTRQPGSPSSALVTPHPAVALGRRAHLLEQLAPAVGAQRLRRGRRARRGRARAGPASAAAGRPGRRRSGRRAPARGAGRPRRACAASSRSSRAIWSRRSRRAARSSTTPARRCGGLIDGHRRPPSWRQSTHRPVRADGRRRRAADILCSVPRNDPTDTGGLFIGRRPGTAPVHYRTPPERGSARRRRADALLAAAVLVLEALVVLSALGPAAGRRGCGSARRSTTAPAACSSASPSRSSA